MPLLESIWQDLRFGARSLLRTPAVTVPVIARLMLGIGANVVLLSIVYAVLFRPLPYQDPDRLVWIGEAGNSIRAGYELVLTSDIADWRAQSSSLPGIAALDLGIETLAVNGELDRLWAVEASESPDRVLEKAQMEHKAGASGSLGPINRLTEDLTLHWTYQGLTGQVDATSTNHSFTRPDCWPGGI